MNLYNDEEHPKALQFAEQLDADECADIADELRRLHNENRVYSATIRHLEHENDAQLRKLVSAVRQRDELLEALQKLMREWDTPSEYLEAARNARAALEQPQVNSPEIPEGWRLVPVEPSPEMVTNGAVESYGPLLAGIVYQERVRRAWQAMLAAAPQPPVVKQPQSVTDCHQSQQQDEQEPVAWMHQCRKKPELVKLSFKKREPALAASGYKARPLIFGDTVQPRQPLTDADLWVYVSKELADYTAGDYADYGCAKDQLIHFARAIERAHEIVGTA